MRVEFSAALSRILIKARKRYRFTGIVIGRIGIGIIWPSAKETKEAPVDQPALPGLGE